MAAKLYLLIFLQSAYGQQSPSNGMWVEIYPNNTTKKLQERCETLDDGVYLGILFVDGLYTEYLKTNKALWGKIKKMQRLKNTSFEKVDISYGSGRLTDDRSYNNDKREL